jgi:dienelactone hydrolase
VTGRPAGHPGLLERRPHRLLAACHRPDVRALVSLHGHVVYPETTEGRPVSSLDITDRLQAAVLLLYGADGQRMTRDEVRLLDERLASTGRTFESQISDVPRGFHNPSSRSCDEPSVKDTWSRVTNWLKRHLA